MVKTEQIQLETDGFCDLHDITGEVSRKVRDSGMKSGIVTVFVPGATGGITTIEYESGLIQDFRKFWEKLLPQDDFYTHNARWHDGNGFSHIRASILGPSITVPFVDKKLTLGTWQQIIFVDFDNKNRNRTLIMQIMGE